MKFRSGIHVYDIVRGNSVGRSIVRKLRYSFRLRPVEGRTHQNHFGGLCVAVGIAFIGRRGKINVSVPDYQRGIGGSVIHVLGHNGFHGRRIGVAVGGKLHAHYRALNHFAEFVSGVLPRITVDKIQVVPHFDRHSAVTADGGVAAGRIRQRVALIGLVATREGNAHQRYRHNQGHNRNNSLLFHYILRSEILDYGSEQYRNVFYYILTGARLQPFLKFLGLSRRRSCRGWSRIRTSA